MKRYAYVAALSIALFSSSGWAAGLNGFAEKARSVFEPIVSRYDIPGLVVGVTRNGEHAFYAVGVASKKDAIPVNPDTLFELGSISKLFNVTLAAWAEERRLLNLNETVAAHICGNLCSIGDNLTLMDLATHRTGGLPLQVPDGLSNVEELITWLKEWRPPQPGTRSYSNISIGLLGFIAGKAMGTGYKQALEEKLFPAFGMRHTWIDVPDGEMDSYAFGYDRTSGEAIRVAPGLLDSEAYGVKSSARDMLAFMDVHLGGGNAPEDLRDAVLRTREGQFRTAFYTQVMIWEQYPWPVDLKTVISGNSYDFIMKPQPIERISPPISPEKDVFLNKTGSTNGFGGYIVILPGEKLGIVVLANKNYPNEVRVTATYSLIQALLSE